MGRSDDVLFAAFSPHCAELGVELVDVELRSGTLQVTVERADGLALDAVAEVARALSDLLDERDDLAPSGRYELEVTSPGVERRLRRPEHFAAALGRRVALKTVPGTAGDRRLEGELCKVDDTGVTVAGPAGERRLAFGEIDRAHTVFDWRAALARAGSATGDDGDEQEVVAGEGPGGADARRDPGGPAAKAAGRAATATRERAATT